MTEDCSPSVKLYEKLHRKFPLFFDEDGKIISEIVYSYFEAMHGIDLMTTNLDVFDRDKEAYRQLKWLHKAYQRQQKLNAPRINRKESLFNLLLIPVVMLGLIYSVANVFKLSQAMSCVAMGLIYYLGYHIGSLRNRSLEDTGFIG